MSEASWAQLRAFVAVADGNGVAGAAAGLHVTQPAVSAALAGLGRALGVALFRREGRRLALTEAGAGYLDYARSLLGLLEEGALAAQGRLRPGAGLLRIAAVTSAAEHVLPAVLATFRTAHPGFDIRLEVAPRGRIWRALQTYQVDAVVAGRPPDSAELRTAAVRSNRLVVVGAPDLAPHADVSTATWLLREPESGTRETAEALLEALRATATRLTLGSNGAVVAGACVGLGVALVSTDAVARELAGGALRVLEVPGTPLDRPYHLVTHHRSTPVVSSFVAHLLDHPTGGWGHPPASAVWASAPPEGGAATRRS
jgi:DNA-binding transcriptional LysR family regulator